MKTTLPSEQSILLKAMLEQVENNTLEEDEVIINTIAVQMYSLQSLKRYQRHLNYMDLIVTKWEERRDQKLFDNRFSREAKTLRRAKMVQSELRKQGKRIHDSNQFRHLKRSNQITRDERLDRLENSVMHSKERKVFTKALELEERAEQKLHLDALLEQKRQEELEAMRAQEADDPFAPYKQQQQENK